MTDSIYISTAVGLRNRRTIHPDLPTAIADLRSSSWHSERALEPVEIGRLTPKELSNYLQLRLGSLGDQDLCYDKMIVIKVKEGDEKAALELRLDEVMKFEDTKRVVFGVFGLRLSPPEVSATFERVARRTLKAKRAKAAGHVWGLQINGTGKGCGIIGADDKLRIWRDHL